MSKADEADYAVVAAVALPLLLLMKSLLLFNNLVRLSLRGVIYCYYYS